MRFDVFFPTQLDIDIFIANLHFFLFLFFRENDCEIIWTAFEQSYIGRDPCDVPPKAYDPLINSVKENAVCNTVRILHPYTKACFKV